MKRGSPPVYATIELNGFPTWLSDLSAAQPVAVDGVLGGELASELAQTESSYLPVLQNVASGDIRLKRLLAPRIFRSLAAWPSEFATGDASNHSAHHLGQVVRILDETVLGEQRIDVADQCEKRFAADPTGALAMSWLRGLFRFDPQRGSAALESGIDAMPEPGRATYAIARIGGLFGDHDNVFPASVDPPARAEALRRLIRLTYRFVRPEEDQSHEGVYSADARDRAQTARGYLLSVLLDSPGPEARAVLLELTADPLIARITDRLQYLTRERTAKEAEREPMLPGDVAALEERYEAPPHDRDGLFSVIVDRIDDLAHDISHDDLTNRRTLRTITEEIEMQRYLAQRLREMARGAYRVTREEEVADQKCIDIRLLTVRGDHSAAIEVKIADSCSMAELERALRHQLVGQYLRHQGSKIGCLLLTFNGTKTYWEHPKTGIRLNFVEVVAYLTDRARAIEGEHLGAIRIAVVGVDLTDPPLVPAHR